MENLSHLHRLAALGHGGIRDAAGADVTVRFDDGSDANRAALLAQSCDVALVFVGTLSGWVEPGRNGVSLGLERRKGL